MRLIIRLRGPHATVRYRGGLCSRICKGGKLVKILPFLCLAIIVATLGLLAISEVGVTQRRAVGNIGGGVGTRLLPRLSHTQVLPLGNHRIKLPPTVTHPPTPKGDVFKIEPLLKRNAPSVELAAQIVLNNVYKNTIRNNIYKYYTLNQDCSSVDHDMLINCTHSKYNDSSTNTTRQLDWFDKPDCSLYPQHLIGQSIISTNVSLTMSDMDRKTADRIERGGAWRPQDCIPRHKIAIIIPYRDRLSHLITLLNHLHPLLQRQQIQYRIFVVEQYGNDTFNKGTIMNAAFKEALLYDIYHCFIFHDVDMIPENDLNLYTCPQMPRHLSVAVNEFNYKLPYKLLVGGVFAVRTEHFFKVNGYSNLYWGWGGEDDDMAYRLQQLGLLITRPPANIGRYTMIKHVKRKPLVFKVRVKLLRTSTRRYRLDGLNTVSYQLINTTHHEWFTKFLVNIGSKPNNIKSIEKGYT